MIALVWLLKGISYSHVLHCVRFYIKVIKKEVEYDEDDFNREISGKNRKIIEKYLDNFGEFLTGKNFLYFIIAPTLCYQLHFPKMKKIRKIWLAKRILEIVVLQMVQLFIILEYHFPILQKAPEVIYKEPKDLIYIADVVKYVN